ncbi:MAG: metallophosphoesterase family protein [Candidatus Omnitrophica bacterium]|nr:metallophosphoesterase family protein [Candidatus Omnitrophota bacterium]MDD5552761.1 metallophosphoesterase family protein [Candidatus Omnitrophota bacterium]
MKIGVISDTHIPDRSRDIPKQVLDAFKEVDIIAHAGDIADLRVIEDLKKVCKEVHAVWGNMDPYEVRNALPEKDVFEAAGRRIGLTHGYGLPTRLTGLVTEIFKKDNVDIIIFGHSHAPLNKKIGDILYFNPGSPTDKIFSVYNSYGIIELNDKIEAQIIKIM